MVVFGFGEVSASIIFGLLIDSVGAKSVSLLNATLAVCTTAFTLIQISRDKFDTFTFLTCFMWGLHDCATNVHLNQILGFQFANNSMPFAVQNFI